MEQQEYGMDNESASQTNRVLPGPTAFRRWEHDDLMINSNDIVVLTSALSRPLILSLPPLEPEPMPDFGESAKPDVAPQAVPQAAMLPCESPSGVASYEQALAAVFARAELGQGRKTLAPEPAPAPEMPDVPDRCGMPSPHFCTPEGIVAFLSSLPRSLSQGARFRKVEEELLKYPHADPNELVGEAAARLVALRGELARHTGAQQDSVGALQSRIAFLERELFSAREELATQEACGDEHRQALLTSVDEMTGVIVFFDSYQAYLYQSAEGDEGEEATPTFLDDETTLRLLEQNGAL